MTGLRVLACAGLYSLLLAAGGCGLSADALPREVGASSQALPADFECVPGATGPGVYDGDIYISSTSPDAALENVGRPTCVTGTVSIEGTKLTDLTALSRLQMVGGQLLISDNDRLTNLAGLESLRSVGGPVDIAGNDALASLAQLSALSDVGLNPNFPAEHGLLRVANNSRLPACWAWALEGQTGVGCGRPDWQGGWLECVDNLGRGSCGSLPADFACVPGATGPGVFDGALWITPWHDNGPGLDELGGLTCVTGVLAVFGTSADNLEQLSGLRMVGGSLMISDNAELSTLHGLESLEFVGEQLSVASNPRLTSLAPIANLARLGELFEPGLLGNALWLANHESLPACWVNALERQTGTLCSQQDGMGGMVPCEANSGTGVCEL